MLAEASALTVAAASMDASPPIKAPGAVLEPRPPSSDAMARSNSTKKITRIQREKIGIILDAALDVFSNHGFRGATIDMIADKAHLSKPNILYYFDSKDKIHEMLLSNLLETWLEPLKQISSTGEPISEICCYVERKLEMARDFPQESRLFANEILQGAPRIFHALNGPLKKLTDEKVALINS